LLKEFCHYLTILHSKDVEKFLMSKRADRYRAMSTGVWSSEDVVDDACNHVDNDSGIDRDVTSRVSAMSVVTSSSGENRSANNKIWSKFQKVCNHTFKNFFRN